MTTKNPKRPVRMAFEASTVRVAIADILPLRVVRPELKSAKKYTQIAASIRELGIIEPPVIARQRGERWQVLASRWPLADRGAQGHRRNGGRLPVVDR